MRLAIFHATAIFAMASPAFGQTAACPRNATALAEGAKLTCQCPAGQDKPGAGPVSGDNRYTADSSICRAAIHAGKLQPDGGTVTVIVGGACTEFPATERNGVKTMKWGRFAKTFGFGDALPACPVTAAPPPPPPAPAPPSAQPKAPAPPSALAACPQSIFAARTNAVGTKISCSCSAEAMSVDSTVFGSGRYYHTSPLCRAARHAGAVPTGGGNVTAHIVAPCPIYEAKEQNGVKSDAWRAPSDKSLAFSDPPPPCAAAPTTAPAPSTPAPSVSPLQQRANAYAALLPSARAGWTASPARGDVESLPGRGTTVSGFRVYKPDAKAGTVAELSISIANNADGSPGYPIEQWNDEARRNAANWEKRPFHGREALVGPERGYMRASFLLKNNLFVTVSWRQIEPADVEGYVKAIDFAKIEALASK